VAATRLTKLRRGELAFEDQGQPTLDEGFRGLRAMSKRQEELVTPHLRASFCVVAPPNFIKPHQLEMHCVRSAGDTKASRVAREAPPSGCGCNRSSWAQTYRVSTMRARQ